MTTRSRRQTRHRTFGWYAGNPVDHNRTVAIAKAHQRRLAYLDRAPFFALSNEFRRWFDNNIVAPIADELIRTQEIIDDVTTLGITEADAREAINDHRATHPNSSWDHTATIIHNLALHEALHTRSIDQ